MNGSLSGHWTLVGLVLSLVCLAGCPAPQGDGGNAGQGASSGGGKSAVNRGTSEKPDAAGRAATAQAADVDAAKTLLDGFGANAKYTILPGGVLTEIVIQDGSVLSAENITLFGKLTDLEKLQIYNFRELNDEMASRLAGLKNLTTLALTNSVINDPTVETIAKSFPNWSISTCRRTRI
jgi:hypothetical protein